MAECDRRSFLGATGAAAAILAAGGRATGRAFAAVPEASGRTWRVDGARLARRLKDLSRLGANPQGGVSRVAFSPADVEGRAFVAEMMRAAGLQVRIDPVGNILGRRPGLRAEAAPIVFGSHIDSVPEGGNYDGDVGSMSAIEVAEVLRENGYRNRSPLEVAIWCDEESGLTGSRGFVGDLGAEELGRPARDGLPLAENIRRIGGDPARLAEARHEKGAVAAYLELHIEQGGTLDAAGTAIGVVEGIVGIHHYEVVVRGFANHAGTTPMDRRHDALLAASEIVLAVNRIVRSVPGRQVGTVGRLSVRPGAPNVIPGEVAFTVELRDLRTETIESLWARIEEDARAPILSKSRAIFADCRSRSSIVRRTSPGITFGAFGATCSWPTVPTWRPGSAVTISRTASTSCDAATSASFRSGIGVVPAWLAKPRTVAS